MTLPSTARATAALALLALSAGCSGTRATALWRDPARKAPFQKVLVGVAGVPETTRREAEDALVARLPAGAAVASHRVIAAGRERELDHVRAVLAREGIDGVLVGRFLGVDQEASRSSMPTTATVYGALGWASTAEYDLRVADLRKVARVESRLYDLAHQEPVWTLATDTLEPTSSGVVIEEVADLVVRKLAAGGLLGRR